MSYMRLLALGVEKKVRLFLLDDWAMNKFQSMSSRRALSLKHSFSMQSSDFVFVVLACIWKMTMRCGELRFRQG